MQEISKSSFSLRFANLLSRSISNLKSVDLNDLQWQVNKGKDSFGANKKDYWRIKIRQVQNKIYQFSPRTISCFSLRKFFIRGGIWYVSSPTFYVINNHNRYALITEVRLRDSYKVVTLFSSLAYLLLSYFPFNTRYCKKKLNTILA